MPNVSQSRRASRGTTGNHSGLIIAGVSGTNAGLSGMRSQIIRGGNRSAALSLLASALVIVALSAGISNNAAAQEPPAQEQPASPVEASDKQLMQVTLIVDGETRTVPTESKTVGELLQAQNVGLLQQDRCSVAPKTVITDGLTIQITRIRTTTEFVHDKIAIPTLRKPTTSLKPGISQTISEGSEGLWTRKFLIVRKNDVVVSRKPMGESRIPPQPKIILFGSRSAPNALASRGILSRSAGRIIHMVATGYGPGENGKWGDVTSSGRRMGRGVVAVDPRVIRMGTRLHIEGYGYCVAGDVGGAIKGNRVDLGFDSRSQAAAVGRRRVQVTILK